MTTIDEERVWFAGEERTLDDITVRVTRMVARLNKLGREFRAWSGHWPGPEDRPTICAEESRTGPISNTVLGEYRNQEGILVALLTACPPLAKLCASPL